jgi:serine/threonine-protein kinase HipA
MPPGSGHCDFVPADQPFLACTKGKLPPVIQLPALIRAADAIHGESETAQDLRYLLGQGSPLGGARPKSAVQLADGTMGIAKFSKPDDLRDIAAGEVLALALARQAGIRVPDHQLIIVEGRGVAVITRFDRVGEHRIPFISAASLLGLALGDDSAYTSIADAIRLFGDDVTGDLHELWRRMILSLLASNYDDHPRNHGFLMKEPGRWSLSPAYDLNPVPEIDRVRINKTAITEELQEPTIGKALESAARFGLRIEPAKTILREVVSTVSGWRTVGRKLKIGASTLDAYASAFDHALMTEALALVS